MMDLPFPGGPWIDKASQCGDPLSIEFPKGLMSKEDLIEHKFDFSFSGLKTAVARYLSQTPNYLRADVAASFQEAVVDVLLNKSIFYCYVSIRIVILLFSNASTLSKHIFSPGGIIIASSV